MIVLDTNVLSELARPRADPQVIAWLDAQDSADVLITALTAAEVRAGIALMPLGRRRDEIGALMDSVLMDTFAGQVLAVDADSAVRYAEVVRTRTRLGRPIGAVDALIAAVCLQHGATLATRNTADFLGTGLDLVDPWQA